MGYKNLLPYIIKISMNYKQRETGKKTIYLNSSQRINQLFQTLSTTMKYDNDNEIFYFDRKAM